MEIIPAILAKTEHEFTEKLAQVPRAVKTVHLDFCDNGFECPELFPFADRFLFEAHLMLAEPERMIKKCISAGARRVILPVEVMQDSSKLKIFQERVEIGLAINLDTPSEALTPFLSDADTVQFMGIKNVGFQGQPFDPRVIEKVAKFHTAHPSVIISVDGGVNLKNAEALGSAGASRLVVGSAIGQFVFHS